jgi:hypothetical protein
MAAAVDVVELGLRDRVVDVDGREEQRSRFHHLIEAMHARRRLLGNALDVRGDARPALGIALQFTSKELQDHSPLFGLVGGDKVGHTARALALSALMNEQCGVTAIIDDQRWPAPIRPHQRLGSAPPVLIERFALPGEDGNASRILDRAARFGPAHDHGRRGVILRREDVAAHPAHVGAEDVQGLDQDRGLHGHVQRAHDAGTGQGFVMAVLLSNGHQARHLVLGQADLGTAQRRFPQILDFERIAADVAGRVELMCRLQCSGHAVPVLLK